VEQFFLIRLLKDLGYDDKNIKTKESIQELTISTGGRTKEKYKPDYVCFAVGKPRIVIDAKNINENLDDYLYQVSGYALTLNRKHKGDKPIKYCLLSNGKKTKLFPWDEDEPILELDFTDFVNGNKKYERLKSYLSHTTLRKALRVGQKIDYFTFKKPEIKEIIGVFRTCNNLIRSSEKSSPSFAFYEFSKLMFIKIEHDKELRSNLEIKKLLDAGEPLPKDAVVFSNHWIEEEQRKTKNPNPIEVLFGLLRDKLEEEIELKKKKRIFESTEKLRLEPTTIKEIVKLLEHRDLFGIDEDLSGRLFETFLNATMRGKDLGQFFTPRSVVKFMVKLADLQVSKGHRDKVLDACCGTGGFLIETMTHMSDKIKSNLTLTNVEKTALQDDLITEKLFGIDAGKDPPIARIARVNMYLHGDGGSRIYFADALDKKVKIDSVMTDTELKHDREELRDMLVEKKTIFDVILTNPPFAMRYSKKKPNEKEILDNYDLAYEKENREGKLRTSLRSSIMFLERYWELLKPHGKLLTVIDDSILNTDTNSFIRKYIKQKFVIKAIISLPNNTFVNADSGVKTSIVYLIKKETLEESQPNVFMAICRNIGHRDSGKETPELNELPDIYSEFIKFEKG